MVAKFAFVFISLVSMTGCYTKRERNMMDNPDDIPWSQKSTIESKSTERYFSPF